MTVMIHATDVQRIADLESDSYQTGHQIKRLAIDVVALHDQGKLHGELLADALKDLRDLRIDIAEFRTEVKAEQTHQLAYLAAIAAHLGIEAPVRPTAAPE